MLDANNVQAVDFLANKIQRPLKVYMASEQGIQHVLDQYKTDLEEGVGEAIAATGEKQTQGSKENAKPTLVISQTACPVGVSLTP